MIRIQIKLTEDDFRQLRHLADLEYRDPRQQAGILIREALESRGIVKIEQQPLQSERNSKQGVPNG